VKIIQLMLKEPTNCEIEDETVIWIAIPKGLKLTPLDGTDWKVSDTDYTEPEPGTDFLLERMESKPGMTELGERNYSLISMGVKAHGSYDPNAILYVFEEQLYVHEADEIEAFLRWVHTEAITFGHGNYEQAFTQFKGAADSGVAGLDVSECAEDVAGIVCDDRGDYELASNLGEDRPEHEASDVEPQPEVTVVVTVSTDLAESELDEDDEAVAGAYRFNVPAWPNAIEAALDIFHSTVPIAVLDDFEITTEVKV